MNNSEIVDQLKSASDGLLCMSESEYPFEVFLWESPDKTSLTRENLTTQKILELTGQPQDTPVEVVTVDDFFRVATTEQDWYGEEELATLKNYQNLVETLNKNLSKLKVYRIGEIEINVYIVGQNSTGDLVGLSTKVVET
ncbi:nuclease A inhibitor family protein [Coleofasciculus sp. FACHB-SPT9]|uniref:nuclease A inhibitor family protein n=1 Tax=Cyanophyceae TaxID=3028117 RepID=UPI001686F337|nr:nuclease A inhibitor family protein [Coleofasciculus sp. FACHB-SPT9]MBD1892939.1 nuclease A inhibitor family protein [Coleofasciculus sp. FACHB-SPT9]